MSAVGSQGSLSWLPDPFSSFAFFGGRLFFPLLVGLLLVGVAWRIGPVCLRAEQQNINQYSNSCYTNLTGVASMLRIYPTHNLINTINNNAQQTNNITQHKQSTNKPKTNQKKQQQKPNRQTNKQQQIAKELTCHSSGRCPKHVHSCQLGRRRRPERTGGWPSHLSGTILPPVLHPLPHV